MKLPRFNLAGAMTFVAVVALNLGAVRALYDGADDHLLFDALPTANVLAAVAFAGFRRRRLRSFAIGFVLAGAMSLFAYQVWLEKYPWNVIRYLGPPFGALEHLVETAFPDSRVVSLFVLAGVAFAVPHLIVAIAAGGFTAMAMARRRRERLGIGVESGLMFGGPGR